MWHGASGGVAAYEKICRTGFINNLALLNIGWHGRGIYFTHFAPYADYYFLCGGHKPENITLQGEHSNAYLLTGRTRRRQTAHQPRLLSSSDSSSLRDSIESIAAPRPSEARNTRSGTS